MCDFWATETMSNELTTSPPVWRTVCMHRCKGDDQQLVLFLVTQTQPEIPPYHSVPVLYNYAEVSQ